MFTRRFLPLFAVLSALLFVSPLSADPGDLDSLDAQLSGGGNVSAVAVQPDGKFLMGGIFTAPRLFLARFQAAGTLDAAFTAQTDNEVRCVAVQPDGKIVIGGAFTEVTPTGSVTSVSRSFLARLNADGTLDTAFDPQPDAAVNALALQPDGKIVVGGEFTQMQPGGTVAPVARNNVARLNADGTLDTGFDPNANGVVLCLAVQPNGAILLGGFFTSILPSNGTGALRNRLARVDAAGSVDLTFDPSPSASVNCIALDNAGRIVFGGAFTSVRTSTGGGSTPLLRMARVAADGVLDTTFKPTPNGVVNSLALQTDGKWIVGGLFTALTPNGGSAVSISRLVRLNSTGTIDTTFSPEPNAEVRSVALQADGKVLVGGAFTTLRPNGAPSPIGRVSFARLQNDAVTQTLAAVDRSKVLWTRSGATPELAAVAFDLSTDSGATWTALGAGARVGTTTNWEVTGLALSGGQLRARGRLVGGLGGGSVGLIEQVQAITFPTLTPTVSAVTSARFQGRKMTVTFTLPEAALADSVTLTFNDGTTTTVFTVKGSLTAGTKSLSFDPDSPMASNLFKTASALADGTYTVTLSYQNGDGGAAASSAAKTGVVIGSGVGPGALDAPFAPQLDAAGSVAAALGQPDGKVVIVGGFSTVEGTSRHGVARVNADGSLDPSFDPGTGIDNGAARCAAQQGDGKVVVGGTFTSVNGQPRSRLARFLADGSLEANFSPSTNGEVLAVLAQTDGKLLLAGAFTTVNGQPREHLARLLADGTLDPNFAPTTGTDDFVYSLAVQPDGKILLGGPFDSVGGQPRPGLARLNADGSLEGLATFNPGTGGHDVYGIVVQPDGKIVIVGSFAAWDGQNRGGIARLLAGGGLESTTTFNPGTGALGVVAAVALQVDGKIVIGGQFTKVNELPRQGLARLNADGTVESSEYFDAAVAMALTVSVQGDGRILVGGSFSDVSGTARNHLARLLNDPATQTLTAPDQTQVQWTRTGAAGEVADVSFDASLDGTTWAAVGRGTRVAGGWELTGLNLDFSGFVRARGRMAMNSGYQGGAALIEQKTAVNFPAQSPTLASPAPNSFVSLVITVSFTLPQTAATGSVKLRLDGANVYELELAGVEDAGLHSFWLTPENPTASTNVTRINSQLFGVIPDGAYDLTLTYRDALLDRTFTVTNTGVTLDTVTLQPSLTSPAAGARFGGPTVGTASNAVAFSLPEAALAGSVQVTFHDGTTARVLTLGSAFESAGDHLLYFKPGDPVGTCQPANAVASLTNGPGIPEGGPYAVSVAYRDALRHDAVASSPHANVIVDTATESLTLTKPAPGAIVGTALPVQFTLPENAAEGSLKLRFFNANSATTLTLADSLGTAGTHSFTFDPRNPAGTAIVTGSTIPDDVYSVELSYNDALSNGVASTTSTDVTVDTKSPTFVSSFSPTIVFAGTTVPDYRAQAGATDENGVATLGQTPALGTVLSEGRQMINVTATDAAGNSSGSGFELIVRPLSAKQQAFIKAGDVVPGAGTAGGPPAGAKATTFGLPAIDDNGGIAYVGQWNAPDNQKGAGLFANNACLAVIGGDASALAGTTGAKWKSFTAPVIADGSVAAIATFSGVAKTAATAVVSNAATGAALELVARAGAIAPLADGSQPTGGATFKAFKGVAVAGASVGIFAQLGGGTGPAKATPASDLGLWMKSGSDPLRLVVREGSTIELAPGVTRKIATLVSFGAGSGSPGQGRGWLAEPYGATALALLLFTDQSQAILAGTPGGGLILSQTAKTGGDGPALPDATFASYGFPAMNDSYTTAFLGSMTAGPGGVTKADARGVFLSGGQSGYSILARVGKPSGVGDTTFSVLKDPVLANDGGIAFLATLKGTSIKGAAASTLWWQPAGGALAILAQGAARPGLDLPAEAQWKAFSSLAIAARRGPIFAATLVPGKGGVTPANASGVWACDFTGAPRLLFRTGDPIDLGLPGAPALKKVKTFTLLKATVGSTGVTRSFNDAAQVVWLATFTDKTQAIVTTDVP